MSRGSNVGRGVLVVGAAAAMAGMLSYTPPDGREREVRAASAPVPTTTRAPAPVTTARPRPKATTTIAPVRSRPKVTTTTRATTTTRPPDVSTTVPPTTVAADAPPPEETSAEETSAPAAAAAEAYYPAPSPLAYAPAPEAEDDTADSAGPARAGTCELFAGLISILDDPSLRTAVATVGCV